MSVKTLIVYFSRTGTTKRVADLMSQIIKCDIEEIIDAKNRDGIIGYLISGKDAATKSLSRIKDPLNHPSNYDLVIVGTPIWARNISSPVRTYLDKHKSDIKNIAFFCTMGNSGSKKAFLQMEAACGKKPMATLDLKSKNVKSCIYVEKVNEFIKMIE